MGKSCYTIRSNRFGEAIGTDGKYIPVCDLPFEAQESGKEYSTKQIVGWAAHDLIPLQWGIKDTD